MRALLAFLLSPVRVFPLVASQDAEVAGPAWYSDVLESSGPGFSVCYIHILGLIVLRSGGLPCEP